MTQESTKNPPDQLSINDYSKEISVAEDLCKQALDKYKQVSIDRLAIQHSVIKNYLWLSVTILVAELTITREMFPLSFSHACPLIFLAASFLCALFALLAGIRAMTGTTIVDPSDNYVEMFDYLTANGYDQGNHYALLQKTIRETKKSIEQAYDTVHTRGKFMRKMNTALIYSVASGVLSGFLFLVSTHT